jgi:hypothetical protein
VHSGFPNALYYNRTEHERDLEEHKKLLSRPLVSLPFKAQWLRDAPTILTFNIYALCPHSIYVFCIYLKTNSDLYHLHHKLIGFYNLDEKCLLRGTNWVFK